MWAPPFGRVVQIYGTTHCRQFTSSGARVLDLGCGTGRITVVIAHAGFAVTGVDPHQPSITAKQKLDADRVEWVIDDSRAIPVGREFGVAILSSKEVQAIREDENLSRALRDIAAHMPSSVAFRKLVGGWLS